MSKQDEIVAIIQPHLGYWHPTAAGDIADRILACLAEPTEAMVEAALNEFTKCLHVRTPRGEAVRAALVAAGRAMGGNDGK